MKFNDTIEGNIDLAAAIAKIIETAKYLQSNDIDKNTKYQLVWALGFYHLSSMEKYRIAE